MLTSLGKYTLRNKKDISIAQLLTSVSFLFERNKFSYIERQGKNNYKMEFFTETRLSSPSHPEEVVRQLKENQFFDEKYSLIDVSILTNKFTLIPAEHFDEDLAETYLNYTVPFSENQALRFNLIPQFDLVIVFYYPEELENIFSESSQKVRVTYTGFKFLSKIKSSDRKDGVFLNTYQEYFEVAVVRNEKLILYNVYPYAVVQDILYFLEVISKNIKFPLSESDLYYFGNIEDQKGNLAKLSLEFKTVSPGVDDDFERINFTILDLV